MDGVRRTVLADEITVEKRAAGSQFNMPAVILEIASTADQSMMITLTEPIPGSFPMENIGFHPDYGGEHWSMSAEEIVFARTIDPGEEYTTVYGVRSIGTEDITTFVDAETSVSTGEGVAAEADVDDANDELVSALLTEDDDEVVRNVISGDDDSLSTPESTDQQDSTPESDPDEQEPTPEPDPDEQEPTPESDPDEQEPTPESDPDEQEPTPESDPDQQDSENTKISEEGESAEHSGFPGSVAEALASEIRDGTISEEHERVLREAFSGAEDTQRDVDIRIKRLQTEVSDLSAYMDEFERLLGEHGGGDGPFASLESTLVSVADRVDELEDDVDAVNGRLADIESDLDALRKDLDGDRSEDIDVLGERLESVEAELEDLPYFEEEVMEDMKAFHDRLSGVFDLDGGRSEKQEE
jgi:archaellum component FlaC